MLERILALAALLVAAFALMRVRQVSRRIDRLTESYWELRYEYGQVRARLARLEGTSEPEAPHTPPPAPNFIPLASLKR